MENNLFSILERFSDLKVLVLGEAILDTYVRGRADRLTLEAPAPVVQVRDGLELPGGAANAALHARRLGASVKLLSLVGNDAEGDRLLEILAQEGVDVEDVICASNRRTLLKRRVYADDRLLLRYDQGSSDPIDAQTEQYMLKVLEAAMPKFDVLLLSDYDQGVLTQGLLQGLARIQRYNNCMVVADTRRLSSYRDMRLAGVRSSYHSAMEMLGYRSGHANGNGRANGNGNANGSNGAGAGDPLDRLSEAGENILAMLDVEVVAITLDDNGALVIERSSPTYRSYAQAQPFNRVQGAGDAYVTALALSLGAGARGPDAAEIASTMASIVVHKEGMPFCCVDELKGFLTGDQKYFEDWDSLGGRLDALRQQGKRVVFTNGVFDILHSAHVSYLNQARSFGDVLVVGVNSDESVRRLKGPTRPINQLIERCRVLSGLACVDFVVPFGEKNPINLIHVVRPDVYVKGGDYTRETLPEAAVVEGYGGTLQIVPYIENHSTTGVIERIRKMDIQK